MAKFAIARRRFGGFRAPAVRYRTRMVRVGRAGLSAAGRAARTEKHLIAAVGAAAVLGFMRRSSVDLPKVDAIGTAGTYGLLAYGASKLMKGGSGSTLAHVATGLLSVAAAELASGGTVSGDFDDTSGEFGFDDADDDAAQE